MHAKFEVNSFCGWDFSPPPPPAQTLPCTIGTLSVSSQYLS